MDTQLVEKRQVEFFSSLCSWRKSIPKPNLNIYICVYEQKHFCKLGAMMLRDLFLFLFHITEKKSTAR